MNKLSVILIVRNEEKNIKRCLESVSWAAEIILVDQSSADRTVEIAREYTDKIFVTEPKNIPEPDREFAVSKTANDWVLLLDADEVVPADLKEEILSVLAAPASEVYMLPRKAFFVGRSIQTCGWYPAYVPRLFKKGKVVFPARIHADGDILTGSVSHLRHDLLHYSYSSVGEWIEKFNRYTGRAAREQFDAGREITAAGIVSDLLVKPVYFFLLKYFVLKGYKDGWRGFFISVSSGLVVFFVFIKLWELRDGRTGGANAG